MVNGRRLSLTIEPLSALEIDCATTIVLGNVVFWKDRLSHKQVAYDPAHGSLELLPLLGGGSRALALWLSDHYTNCERDIPF